MGYPQPQSHHIHKALLPQGHHAWGFLQGLCPGVPCMGYPFPRGLCLGVRCTGHPLPWDLCPGHSAWGIPPPTESMPSRTRHRHPLLGDLFPGQHAQGILSHGICARGYHVQGIPFPWALCPGPPCTPLGWDMLSRLHETLSSWQHLGEHFTEVGTRGAVLHCHTRSRARGSGRGAVGGMGSPSAPRAGAEGPWPCPFSASSVGCGRTSRTR